MMAYLIQRMTTMTMTVFPMMKTVIKRILTMTALLMIWTMMMIMMALPIARTLMTTMMALKMTRTWTMTTMVFLTLPKKATMTTLRMMEFLMTRIMMRITMVFRILKITMMTTTVFQTTWRMICPERAESILSVSATEQPGDASSFCLPQLFSSFATGNPRRSSTRSGNWRRRRKRKLEKHNFSEVDLTLHFAIPTCTTPELHAHITIF